MVDPMKKILFVLLLVAFAFPAAAKDEKNMYPYAAVMQSDDGKLKLDQDIKFYFGDQSHSAIEKKLGSFVSNKKTSSIGKSTSPGRKK